MSLEQILEQTAHARPGYDLVSFKEAGLPVYVLKLRILVLERKALSPIEEAVLKAVRAGLDEPGAIFEFLGLSRTVLTPVLTALNRAELINYSRGAADAEAKVTLAAKGRLALAEAATVSPQERVVSVCFDALTKKLLLIAPEQLDRARDMRALGYFEVPTGTSKRPEVEDIPLQDFDKILQRQSVSTEPSGTLLAVRRIERRELHFLRCVMLFYKNPAHPPEVEVAFWREDGPAMEHEMKFQAIGGPDLVGARLLTLQAASTPETHLPVEEPDFVGKDVQETLEPTTPTQAASSPQATKANDSPRAPATPPDPETMQTLLCHEHPQFLKKALLSAKRRLVIVSPWIRDSVIDWPFIASLEALLKSGVEVFIGYGIEKADANGRRNAANDKPDISPRADADLKKLAQMYKNFHFVYVGNTHRKSLVCDDQFAVVTSFNWLSYKGDSRGSPRDERGIVFRKKHHVERLLAEELELLGKGYTGASRATSGKAAKPTN
jgi:DNA-binding MarR family transcriptional regulator